jgi:hypothetical protein
VLVLPEKNGGDEEARNYEEDINANESTRQPLPLKVEGENREHCYRSEPINGGTILEGRFIERTGEAHIRAARIVEAH